MVISFRRWRRLEKASEAGDPYWHSDGLIGHVIVLNGAMESPRAIRAAGLTPSHAMGGSCRDTLPIKNTQCVPLTLSDPFVRLEHGTEPEGFEEKGVTPLGGCGLSLRTHGNKQTRDGVRMEYHQQQQADHAATKVNEDQDRLNHVPASEASSSFGGSATVPRHSGWDTIASTSLLTKSTCGSRKSSIHGHADVGQENSAPCQSIRVHG